jgi:hypothetical protein
MRLFRLYKGSSLHCSEVENLSERIANAVREEDSYYRKHQVVDEILAGYTIIRDPYETKTGGFLWRLSAPLLFILFIGIRFLIMPVKFVITGDSWFKPNAKISRLYSYVGRKTGWS